MPQIRTYAAPNLGLQPSETGVEATANAARLGGRLYSQAAASTQELGNETQRFGAETASVGEGVARDVASTIKDVGNTANQYIEHQEISHGAAAFTGLQADLTQQWNATVSGHGKPGDPDYVPPADPNDPTVAQKFRENVIEPALDDFNKGFLTDRGQSWADAHVEALRNHLYNVTSADMSTLAGKAVEMNIHASANNMSNTAMSDPSQVPNLIGTVDSTIDGVVSSSPNLKGVAAATVRTELSQKLKEQIVKSGAYGAIQNSPDPVATAKKWAADYPDFINGPEEITLARAAQVQARTNNALQKQTQIFQKQIDELNVHQGANDVFTRNVSTDQTGRVIVNPNYFKDTLDLVKNNPNAPNAATVGKTLLDWGEAQQKPGQIVSDQTTVNAIDGKMFADTDATTRMDVLRAEADKKMSRSDAQVRLEIIAQRDNAPFDPKLKQSRSDFFKRYAAAIDPSMSNTASANYGHYSALGAQQAYAAEMDAFRQEQVLRSKGQDPHSLYDPASPNFFGNSLSKYRVSMQDAAKYQASIEQGGGKPSVNIGGPNTTITGVSVENAPPEKPPMDGARKAPDGLWYVQKDGKWFRVKQ